MRDDFSRAYLSTVVKAITTAYNRANKDFSIVEVETSLGDDKVYPNIYSTYFRAEDIGGFPYPFNQSTSFSIDWLTCQIRWGGAASCLPQETKQVIDDLVRDVEAQLESIEYMGFYTSLMQDEVSYE